ncbi:MAG: hypothetical protein KC731_10380 [Myxococcales bacterium]|nr:hypothetical protein [Myxococcales bacterium]
MSGGKVWRHMLDALWALRDYDGELTAHELAPLRSIIERARPDKGRKGRAAVAGAGWSFPSAALMARDGRVSERSIRRAINLLKTRTDLPVDVVGYIRNDEETGYRTSTEYVVTFCGKGGRFRIINPKQQPHATPTGQAVRLDPSGSPIQGVPTGQDAPCLAAKYVEPTGHPGTGRDPLRNPKEIQMDARAREQQHEDGLSWMVNGSLWSPGDEHRRVAREKHLDLDAEVTGLLGRMFGSGDTIRNMDRLVSSHLDNCKPGHDRSEQEKRYGKPDRMERRPEEQVAADCAPVSTPSGEPPPRQASDVLADILTNKPAPKTIGQEAEERGETIEAAYERQLGRPLDDDDRMLLEIQERKRAELEAEAGRNGGPAKARPLAAPESTSAPLAPTGTSLH